MGRRRRYTDGGGSSTADEIADGIGAFTSTFNTMNQAFDRADQMKMVKEDHAYKVQERERADTERLQMENYVKNASDLSRGHVGNILPELNNSGFLGKGRSATGYKIDTDGNGAEIVSFNVKDADGNESWMKFGPKQELQTAYYMYAAPPAWKAEALKKQIEATTDPEKIARLKALEQSIQSNTYSLKKQKAEAPYYGTNAENSATASRLSVETQQQRLDEEKEMAPIKKKLNEISVAKGEYELKNPTPPAAKSTPFYNPNTGQVISYAEAAREHANALDTAVDPKSVPSDLNVYMRNKGAVPETQYRRASSATGLSGGSPAQTSAPAPQTDPAPGVVSGAMGSAAPASRFQPGKVYKVKDKQGNVLEKTWTGTGWK